MPFSNFLSLVKPFNMSFPLQPSQFDNKSNSEWINQVSRAKTLPLWTINNENMIAEKLNMRQLNLFFFFVKCCPLAIQIYSLTKFSFHALWTTWPFAKLRPQTQTGQSERSICQLWPQLTYRVPHYLLQCFTLSVCRFICTLSGLHTLAVPWKINTVLSFI